MIEYYLIAAFSFSIMFLLRYSRLVIRSLSEVCAVEGIDLEEHFSPSIYLFIDFFVIAIFFPLYFYRTLTMSRDYYVAWLAEITFNAYFSEDDE